MRNLTTTSPLTLLQCSPWHLQHPVLGRNRDEGITRMNEGDFLPPWQVVLLANKKIPRLHLSRRSLRRDECWATTAWWYIRLRPSTTNTSWRRENVNIRADEQKALYRTKHQRRTHVWVEVIDHAPWLKLHGGLMFDAFFPGFTLQSGAQTICQVTSISLATADNRPVGI